MEKEIVYEVVKKLEEIREELQDIYTILEPKEVKVLISLQPNEIERADVEKIISRIEEYVSQALGDKA